MCSGKMSQDAVIEVRGLAKSFNGVQAVAGVDFEVRKGEMFGFLGPNGAGKTTTVRMLTGVLVPTDGTALVEGHDIRTAPLLSRAHLGVVPEEANVYRDLSVWWNVMLYYLQPPVLIFGVLFPVFFFLAFRMGRPVAAENIVPGMVAMALWFTASAVGPLVTPWERRARTYERLIATPVSLHAILAGDVISGLIFGAGLSVLPVLLGVLLTEAAVVNAGLLVVGLVLGAVSFSALGVLLAAPPASSPSNIMLLSNLVRLPLLFVSGIFVPISQMPAWARWISPLSPLSHAGAIIRRAFGQSCYFPLWLSISALVLFTILFFWAAMRFHRRWKSKGL